MSKSRGNDLSPLDLSRNSPKFHREILLEDPTLSGWILHEHRRVDKKHIDRYYFSPKLKKKFRSKTEVEAFLEILDQVGSDNEDLAWDRFQGRKSKKTKTSNRKQRKSNSTKVVISSRSKNSATAPTYATATVTPKIDRKNNDTKLKNRSSTSTGTECLWESPSGDEYYSSGSDYEDDTKMQQLKKSSPSREFAFRARKRFFDIQEAKQVTLTPEERNKILFAEAVITAVDEHEYKKATTKPDPYSAFDFQGDLVAEPKNDHDYYEVSSSKKRSMKETPTLKEAKKMSKIQKNSFASEEKLIAEKK